MDNIWFDVYLTMKIQYEGIVDKRINLLLFKKYVKKPLRHINQKG